MNTFKLSVIAGALAVASVPGFAADTQTVLTSMQAPVMVNQGEAYIDAQDSMMLNAGDRLMVMQGGSAQIQFANGCVQSIRANEIVTVGTADSCMTAEAAGTYNQVGGTGGSGGSGGGGPQGAEWLGVGAIAGVGGYIVYKALDDDDNDRGPASP
ncbi:MAG: hypothetical protein ABJN62_12795 [Halioglobus sp.]